MPVEQIEVGEARDHTVTLKVTLRGTAAEVVDALANGLPREALVTLRDAFTAELQARAERRTNDATQ